MYSKERIFATLSLAAFTVFALVLVAPSAIGENAGKDKPPETQADAAPGGAESKPAENAGAASLTVKVTPLDKNCVTSGSGPFLVASPDARRWAAVLRGDDGKQYLSLDGKKFSERVPANPAMCLFSPDSKHFAYFMYDGNDLIVSVDGAETLRAKWANMREMYFDSAGRFIYVAWAMEDVGGTRMQREWVVIDGKPSAKYDRVWRPAFSPDAKHTAFIARSKGKIFMVTDDAEGKPYDNILTDAGARFTPNSKSVMFVAGPSGKERLVMGDTEFEQFNQLPVYSPDFTRAAYVGRFPDKAKIFIGADPTQPAAGITFNYSNATDVVFSPDSQRYAFAARGKDGWVCVVDGKETAYLDVTDARPPVFSPDSKRVSFVLTMRNGRQMAVTDAVKGNEYKPIDSHVPADSPASFTSPVFSPDSKHVAYTATTLDGKKMVVVDACEVAVDAAVVSNLVFDSPAHLHAIGVSGDNVFLIEIDIK
jgi:hypothetical protein